jgi:hypothetical protein
LRKQQPFTILKLQISETADYQPATKSLRFGSLRISAESAQKIREFEWNRPILYRASKSFIFGYLFFQILIFEFLI